MKINTRTVWQMTDNGFDLIEEDSYEYDGPVAQCFGGRSSTSAATTTTQSTETTQLGFEDTEGLAVGGGRDVEFNLTTVDPGAIQGAVGIADSAFDFAGEFGSEAFDFANSVSRQAGETSQQAVETSRQAIAVVGTGGQSEITGQFANVLKFGAVAIAVVLGIMAFRSAK